MLTCIVFVLYDIQQVGFIQETLSTFYNNGSPSPTVRDRAKWMAPLSSLVCFTPPSREQKLRPTRIRDMIMNGTPLSREILLEKGFVEKTKFGQEVYVKGDVALVNSFKWVPCYMESGEPLATNVYVDTWEELEKLMQEGGQI